MELQIELYYIFVYVCQGSKSSPRSIWPKHLLPGMHIKIGVRAQNSQILSQGACAKIPVEIFNWVQAPINGDALIRMLIKLSFLLLLEPCDSNLALQPWGWLFPLTLHWLPPPASRGFSQTFVPIGKVAFLVHFPNLLTQMDSWLLNHDQTLSCTLKKKKKKNFLNNKRNIHIQILLWWLADCCGLLVLNCGATSWATEETHSRHS